MSLLKLFSLRSLFLFYLFDPELPFIPVQFFTKLLSLPILFFCLLLFKLKSFKFFSVFQLVSSECKNRFVLFHFLLLLFCHYQRFHSSWRNSEKVKFSFLICHIIAQENNCEKQYYKCRFLLKLILNLWPFLKISVHFVFLVVNKIKKVSRRLTIP